MLTPYAYLALFLVFAIAFSLVPLLLARAIRVRKPNPVKYDTYECGVETVGSAWVQYRPGFYLYALLFVVFDVEAIFLYPWAVIYRGADLAWFLFGEVLVFVGILALGLWYAWQKRALTWQ